jgi:hypothetical protein
MVKEPNIIITFGGGMIENCGSLDNFQLLDLGGG